MADLASQVQKILGTVFSEGGIAGVPLSSRAVLHLSENGSYDPATGEVGSTLYFNPDSGAYDSQTPPEVLLISEPIRSQLGSDGSIQSFRKFLILPLHGLLPGTLVGSKIEYLSEEFSIVQTSSKEMRGQSLIWELICQ